MISARMLKETALSMTPAVTKLFNLTIRLGDLPNEWKIARVTPVPKTSNRSDATNYRPISLLSILSKLLERHMRNLLLDHLIQCSPISAQQWGFSRGKSATGALLAATDQWHQWLDSGTDICTVFFDYRKAFDSVPHIPLLEKLQGTNINSYLLRWIATYLTSREQYVCVNGVSSTMLPVKSGVPQGSVIGPLLFIFYVNDITTTPLSSGTLSLFADDLLLYHPIRSAADYLHLQADVEKLCVWSDSNHLKFNGTKCKYMVISRKRQPIQPVQPLMVNNTLERVYSYKYLGIWLTSTLNWSTHVMEVSKKARSQLGIIYRNFYQHSNNATLCQLYLSYVRPHLEYAAMVWDPHQLGLIKSLEKVQKFALRMATRNWNLDYDSLLGACDIQTLQTRRHNLKLCFLFQVVNGHLSFPNAPLVSRPTLHLRNSNPHLLVQPVVHSKAHQFSFFPHSISLWNQLPNSVYDCETLPSFKFHLRSQTQGQ